MIVSGALLRLSLYNLPYLKKFRNANHKKISPGSAGGHTPFWLGNQSAIVPAAAALTPKVPASNTAALFPTLLKRAMPVGPGMRREAYSVLAWQLIRHGARSRGPCSQSPGTEHCGPSIHLAQTGHACRRLPTPGMRRETYSVLAWQSIRHSARCRGLCSQSSCCGHRGSFLHLAQTGHARRRLPTHADPQNHTLQRVFCAL